MRRIETCVYRDTSTRGKRADGTIRESHDCFRGEIRIMEMINGEWERVKRTRKRFKVERDAYEWVQKRIIV